MKRAAGFFSFAVLALVIVAYLVCWMVDDSAASPQTEPKRRDLQTAKDPASLDARKKILDEREAAITAREQQVNALATEVNTKSAEIESAKRNIAAMLEEQKKFAGERARKTLKIYRSLRPEESAKLLDKLDEATATSIINALDQKTIMQLIPYLNQARVLRWTKETLSAR